MSTSFTDADTPTARLANTRHAAKSAPLLRPWMRLHAAMTYAYVATRNVEQDQTAWHRAACPRIKCRAYRAASTNEGGAVGVAENNRVCLRLFDAAGALPLGVAL